MPANVPVRESGTATVGMLFAYLWWSTPQFLYYIIAIAVLLAALVTIGALTKSSELIVMRACGISLYRTAMPMLAFAVGAAAMIFGLQETVLATSNRHADQLRQDGLEARILERATVDAVVHVAPALVEMHADRLHEDAVSEGRRPLHVLLL